jgi:hypothetical protein
MELAPFLFFLLLGILIVYLIYRWMFPTPTLSASANDEGVAYGQNSNLKCMRCFDTNMIYNGTERFHVGSNSAPFILGDMGELFVSKQVFDVYYCPNCGKVEFFFRKKGS